MDNYKSLRTLLYDGRQGIQLTILVKNLNYTAIICLKGGKYLHVCKKIMLDFCVANCELCIIFLYAILIHCHLHFVYCIAIYFHSDFFILKKNLTKERRTWAITIANISFLS